MEKFCLFVSGSEHGEASNLDDLHIEGSGRAIMSSLAFVICQFAEESNIAEDVILSDLERSIKLAKRRHKSQVKTNECKNTISVHKKM